MPDIWSHLQARRRASGGRPLVTAVDVARQERTELSAVSVENAAAKIANALREAFDLDAGAVIGLSLPVHWQRTAWCAGAWTAGCVIALDADPGSVDLVVAGPDEATTLTRDGRSDVAVVSLHPLGLPVADSLPAGAEDVTLAVRQQPDAYLFDPPTGRMPALMLRDAVLTQEEVLVAAQRRAADWGLASGGCLLADDTLGLLDGWLAALAVPLASDTSVVLARGPFDLDRLREQEHITARATPG
jgi:uncharacterized protein (TIGR03089 family)